MCKEALIIYILLFLLLLGIHHIVYRSIHIYQRIRYSFRCMNCAFCEMCVTYFACALFIRSSVWYLSACYHHVRAAQFAEPHGIHSISLI